MTDWPRKIAPRGSQVAKRTSFPGEHDLAPQARELAKIFVSLIVENNPHGFLALCTERLRIDTEHRWALIINDLHMIDGHDWERIRLIIRWSQRHEIYRTVVLGAQNLKDSWRALTIVRGE